MIVDGNDFIFLLKTFGKVLHFVSFNFLVSLIWKFLINFVIWKSRLHIFEKIGYFTEGHVWLGGKFCHVPKKGVEIGKYDELSLFSKWRSGTSVCEPVLVWNGFLG